MGAETFPTHEKPAAKESNLNTNTIKSTDRIITPRQYSEIDVYFWFQLNFVKVTPLVFVTLFYHIKAFMSTEIAFPAAKAP